MKTFRVDDTEVCTSTLTQRSFRAVPCEFLAVVTPQTQSRALEAFAKNPNQFSGLHVSGVADLDFLENFPNLLYLEVVGQERVNTRPLDGLANLRGLRLETPGTGIDFACFPELEVFVGDWHADNANVSRCQELRQLRVWHFKPRSGDLSDLADTTRLEWLTLTRTGVTSLAGLETLEDLRYLAIAHAAKLESLDVLTSARVDLRELELQTVKKVKSYQPLAALRRLRRLRLSGCAPMPDLKWTAGMDHLASFSFVETNVEDGDLTPLLHLPRLRYVGTMDKKHYSHRCDALNELLAARTQHASKEES